MNVGGNLLCVCVRATDVAAGEDGEDVADARWGLPQKEKERLGAQLLEKCVRALETDDSFAMTAPCDLHPMLLNKKRKVKSKQRDGEPPSDCQLQQVSGCSTPVGLVRLQKELASVAPVAQATTATTSDPVPHTLGELDSLGLEPDETVTSFGSGSASGAHDAPAPEMHAPAPARRTLRVAAGGSTCTDVSQVGTMAQLMLCCDYTA